MDAVLTGSGTILAPTVTMNVSAHIYVNTCSPTPADIAEEVWATPLPGSYTGTDAGSFVGSKILSVIKFLALK